MAHPSIYRVLLIGLSFSVTLGTLTFVSSPARADDDDGAAPGVARISATEGDVALKHSADDSNVAAVTNAPVEAGDYLSTGSDGLAEIQLDANDVLRANSSAQLRFTRLDGSSDVAQLAEGTVELRTFDGYRDHVTVQTPSVDVSPDQPGGYIIAVEANGDTEVTARTGSVTVSTPQGSQQLQPGRTMEIAGNANDPQFQFVDTVASNSFDTWNDDRDRELLQVASLAPYEYMNDDIVGADDLDQDGRWISTPQYGEVWRPNDVAANWTPYSNGSWAYEPYYGYTWVAAEPWGWAPYHYGRWFFQPGIGWAWAPGPRIVRPVWSPALVAFFGFGGGGVSLGFGNIGWVPLAPGEPIHRWWGGGNTIVYNNTVVINNYHNYNRGIVAMPVTRWQNGDFARIVHYEPRNVVNVHVIAGRIPLAPTHENYRFAPRETRVTIAQTNYQRFVSRPVMRAPVQQQTRATWQRFGAAPAPARSTMTVAQSHTSTPAAANATAPATRTTWQRFGNSTVEHPQRTYQQTTYARQLQTHALQQPTFARQQPTHNRQEAPSVRRAATYQRQQPARERAQPVQREAPRERQAPHESSPPHKPTRPGRMR